MSGWVFAFPSIPSSVSNAYCSYGLVSLLNSVDSRNSEHFNMKKCASTKAIILTDIKKVELISRTSVDENNCTESQQLGPKD